jgi:hypothetical protein
LRKKEGKRNQKELREVEDEIVSMFEKNTNGVFYDEEF